MTVLVVLAGCGRYEFDPSAGVGVGVDAPPADPSLVMTTAGSSACRATSCGLGNGAHALLPPVYDGSAMVLGADLDGPTLTAPFQGRIDDVRIYNRTLSTAEIVTLATPPP